MTPETQGGAFSGQFELQQAGANLTKIDTSNGGVEDGVIYTDVSRTGFLFSNSLFEPVDFIWSHTGGGNSLLGAKIQFLGSSRTAKGTGHKAGLAFLFGANEHETDDGSVDFELSGNEFVALYGYRLSENLLPYSSFSYATYEFNGKIKSSIPSLNGLSPSLNSKVMTLSGGVEFAYESFFAKAELSYQKLETTDTKEKVGLFFGYSLGLSW